LFKSKLDCGSNRGSDKASPPFVSCLEGPVIVEQPSASGLPGESGDLEATPQVGLQQETPSGPSGGSSDWNGQDHYCNSFQGTVSVRAEDQENQQHVPGNRAEKVTLDLSSGEEVLKHPADVKVQELPTGARSYDDMDGDNPPQGGTGNGFKKCPKRNNQELSSGALRDEVDGDNLPEGGTGNGFRMCTKESGQKHEEGCD